MKHKNLLISAVFLGCFRLVSAQFVTEYTYGDSGWNAPIRIWQMPDDHLALVTQRYAGAQTPTVLLHLDANGDVVAEYPLPPRTVSEFVEPIDDGSSFLYGAIGPGGYTVRRLNLQGQTIDSISFNPPEPVWDDFFFAIRPAPDGGVVMAIVDQDFNSPGIRLVRLNAQGNVVFNRYSASPAPDLYHNCLAVLPDGRSILPLIDLAQGNRIRSYSPSGGIQWTKSFFISPSSAEGCGLTPLDAGKLAFWGRWGYDANAAPVRGFVEVFNADGSRAYALNLEHLLSQFEPYSAFADGPNLVLAGNFSDGNGYGLGVIKLNAAGVPMFIKKFDLLSGDGNFKAAMPLNGDYLFSGFQWKLHPSGGLQSDKAYVLCLQSDGTFNWFVPGLAEPVRLMHDFCHLRNGEIALAGQAFQQQAPPGNIKTLVLRLGDLEPVYEHLIEGVIRADANSNCVPEPAEAGKNAWMVQVVSGGETRYALSDASGHFQLRLQQASGVLSLSPPNEWWAPCNDTYAVDFSAEDTLALELPVLAQQWCAALRLDASAAFLRRCFDNDYHLNWCNEGTVATEALRLEIKLDSFMSFIDATLPLGAQNGQTLYFDLPELAPGDCADMRLRVNLSCTAALGQSHCLSASLKTDNACGDPGGGIAAFSRECQENVGSYDPNDKRAFLNGVLAGDFVDPNTPVTYQIRFQNTGTDTAFNVVIIDTLSALFDFNTLQMGAASHPMRYQLGHDRVLRFIFDDILLPDSNTNEAASHGFVQYTIQQQKDLPPLTELWNKADIYFDYNEAVTTNRHLLTLKSARVNSPDVLPIKAFPNPATGGYVWLDAEGMTVLDIVTLYDGLGKRCAAYSHCALPFKLALPDASGVYWIHVTQHDGSSVVRCLSR